MNLIFGTFGKKVILKHFMRRIVLKRCVLGVFWTAQYVSEVYFTWRRVPLSLWYLCMSITLLGVLVFNSYSKTKQKKFPFTNSYILGICSWMAFLLISAKSQEMLILIWILFFHSPVKLVLRTYGPFSWSASQIFCQKFLKIFQTFLKIRCKFWQRYSKNFV